MTKVKSNMAVTLSPSWRLTAKCGDPNTSWPTSIKNEAERTRQADCQDSSASELPKQTRRKQKGTGKHVFQALLSFLLCFICVPWLFWHPSLTSFPPQTVVINLKKASPNQHWRTWHIISIQFCSIFSTWHDWSGGWNVWQRGWEEHDWRRERETTLWTGQKLSTPCTTGLQSKAVWFMAYGLPHFRETVQFPHEDTADVVASSNASSCCQSPEPKIPQIFPWSLRDTF